MNTDMKYILFSPVGNADPLSNNYDGPLLHICRYLKPDIVYLYLSAHMSQKIIKDQETVGIDRFSKTIQRLGEEINHSFEVILLEDVHMEEPHLFDPVFQALSQHYQDINEQYENMERMYLNVSSGTPAMQNALWTLSLYNANGVSEPVQVARPQGSRLSHNNYGLTLDEQWQKNEDRTRQESRIENIETLKNYQNALEKQNLQLLINNYDYAGAYRIVCQTPEAYTPDFKYYLQGMMRKYELNTDAVNQINKQNLNEANVSISKDLLREYILLWDLKQAKLQENTDYLRALSPMLVHLFNRFLRKAFPRIINYQTEIDNQEIKWNLEKLEREARDLWQIITNGNRNFRLNENISSTQLLNVINNRIKIPRLRKYVNIANNLRDVEAKLRNVVAHQTQAFTEAEIEKLTNFTMTEIREMIRDLAEYTGTISSSDWSEYDALNENLLKLLNN